MKGIFLEHGDSRLRGNDKSKSLESKKNPRGILAAGNFSLLKSFIYSSFLLELEEGLTGAAEGSPLTQRTLCP
jgi:hypothetical protein